MEYTWSALFPGWTPVPTSRDAAMPIFPSRLCVLVSRLPVVFIKSVLAPLRLYCSVIPSLHCVLCPLFFSFIPIQTLTTPLGNPPAEVLYCGVGIVLSSFVLFLAPTLLTSILILVWNQTCFFSLSRVALQSQITRSLPSSRCILRP